MHSELFPSSGLLTYSNRPYRLVLEIDQSISDFYRSLVPKCKRLNRQKYSAHISVVRNEVPPNLNLWEKYHHQSVSFEYQSFIYNDNVYYWLNAFSTQLEEIRLELGLSVSSPYTLPLDGFNKCFHSTLGNSKILY